MHREESRSGTIVGPERSPRPTPRACKAMQSFDRVKNKATGKIRLLF
jgi:hypothetical protein